MTGRHLGSGRKTPPRSRGHILSTWPGRSRGPGYHTEGSSGTHSRRGQPPRRPWGRLPQLGRDRFPGAPGRCGRDWSSRAGAAGRAGPGGRRAGPERGPTSGSSSGWGGFGWPPAARDVERNGVKRLDVKKGRGVGRGHGGRTRVGHGIQTRRNPKHAGQKCRNVLDREVEERWLPKLNTPRKHWYSRRSLLSLPANLE